MTSVGRVAPGEAGDTRRLAILGVPFGLGAGVAGTDIGPAAARAAGLGETLEDIGHAVTDRGDVGGPSLPAASPSVMDALGRNARAAAAWMEAIHDAASAALAEGCRPIFVGGDHTVSMGTVSAVSRHAARQGKRAAVLWIDAHADFNTPRSSPSRNLHGMALSFLTGNADLAPLMAARPFTPVAAADIRLLGTRAIDAAEKDALAGAGLRCLDMRAIDEFGVCALVRQVLDGIDPETTHLHVSLDLDAVDPEVAPGVGTPVPGGMTYREAHLAMELLHDSGRVGSLDLVELNPMLDVRGRTAALAVDLVASLFGKSIVRRARR